MNKRDDVLAWIDLEMTGLDPQTCHIVQMAMVLTDTELKEIASPWEVTIWQPDSVLETMSPFVREMHSRSGLLDKIRASKTSLADAERQALEILTSHAAYRSARLAGNSVWQDRRFLDRYMPAFDAYLHYRIIDVSTLKELASWWYEASYSKPEGEKHTALFDIKQSIAELAFLRERIFCARS